MLWRLQATSVGKCSGVRVRRRRLLARSRGIGRTPLSREVPFACARSSACRPAAEKRASRGPLGTPGRLQQAGVHAPGSRALAWGDYFFSPGTGAASSFGTKCRFWRSIFSTSAFVTLNSTRRFFARPSFDLLEATGTIGP